MFRPAQAETSDPYFEYAASLPTTRSLRRGGGLLGSPRSGAPRNRAARASTGAAVLVSGFAEGGGGARRRDLHVLAEVSPAPGEGLHEPELDRDARAEAEH